MIETARDPESPLLIRNGLYNTGGQALRAAVSLLTVPFLIRFLGLREYGMWSLAFGVLSLMTLSEAGLPVTAAVFLSNELAEDDVGEASRSLTCILLLALTFSIALGFLLWFIGPWIVQALGAFGSAERADATQTLKMASPAVSVLLLQRTLVGVEQAFNRYATINALDFSQSLLGNVGLVVVAWLGGKTPAMMKWQILAYSALLAAHCWFVLRLVRSKRLSLEWSQHKARRVSLYSAATWVSTLGSAAFSQCDRLIVGGVLGAPLLGVYSAITSITAKINSFSAAAVQPLLTSRRRSDSVMNLSKSSVRQATYFNALIAVGAAVILCLLPDSVMRVMVPAATSPRDLLALQIAGLIYALYSFNAPGYFILFYVGEATTNAIVVLLCAAASLGLILAGARYFGLLGAIAGNAGYWGTLLLTVLGLRKVEVSVRQCFAWVAFPILSLVTAFIAGTACQGHLWWRAAFVVVETVLLMFWFLRDRDEFGRMKLALRRALDV